MLLPPIFATTSLWGRLGWERVPVPKSPQLAVVRKGGLELAISLFLGQVLLVVVLPLFQIETLYNTKMYVWNNVFFTPLSHCNTRAIYIPPLLWAHRTPSQFVSMLGLDKTWRKLKQRIFDFDIQRNRTSISYLYCNEHLPLLNIFIVYLSHYIRGLSHSHIWIVF